MKKRIIVFIIFAIAAFAFFLCIKLCIKNKEIVYGDDIEAIQSEFPDIPGIKSCHYKVESIGYYIMARKYGGIPPSSESCEKMKFVTQLSKDEVITRMQ